MESKNCAREMPVYRLRGPFVDGRDAVGSGEQQERLGRGSDTPRHFPRRR